MSNLVPSVCNIFNRKCYNNSLILIEMRTVNVKHYNRLIRFVTKCNVEMFLLALERSSDFAVHIKYSAEEKHFEILFTSVFYIGINALLV